MSVLAGAIGQSKWELDTPALLVDLDVMERNIQRMMGVFRRAGVNWRPHVKCHKSPDLALIQLRAGAIGVTCAKLGEAEVMAEAGITDILIANQIVGRIKIRRLMALLERTDVAVCVDDPENVRMLAEAATEHGRPLRVLIEVNIGMNRAGVEPGEPVLALARTIADAPSLRFVGLMGWESPAATIVDREQKRRAVEEAVGSMTASADLCRRAGLPVEIVSAGGTGTYWATAQQPGVTEVQAGGGIFSDVFYRDRMGVDHECAMTMLSTVVSRPTPTRIVFDAGRKAMSNQSASPEPIGLQDVTSLALSAEHGIVELAEPTPSPGAGDPLELIVGFSDTTVFLHDELYAIRDGRVEAIWPILARGKLR